MFWKFNLMTSHIDTLLDKEDLTLQEILDEDDVLQECKAQNKRLVEFLVLPENMEQLVSYITQEPSEDTDEKCRYKYPNTACELLTSDVNQITEKLSTDNTLLNKVYSFLEGEGPLNPLLASFFSKVMGLLITRKSEMMLEFLQSKEDFTGHLLRHLGTSAIMDLLLRLITCIENTDCHTKCLSWLSEKQLIEKLVAMIDPAQGEEKHCNASQSLCDIIRLSREQMSQLQEKADPDPLLCVIESQETISDLLSHMFGGEKVESVLVNGIAVIQTLLEFKRLGLFAFYSPDGGSEPITSLDAERLAHGVNNTVKALTPRLKDFHQILLDPPKQHYSPMPTTVGILTPPFGNARLQTTKLMTSLLLTKTATVNTELANLGTLGVLLDLCFKYVWNNFLHAQVEQCLATILKGNPSDEEEDSESNKDNDNLLIDTLLTDIKIVDRILQVWEDNDQQQTRPGGHRRGYMGHVTRMANHIITNMEKGGNSEKIKSYVQGLSPETRERWETFVSGSLAETNKQNTVELAGGQNLYSSSEDDDPDFRDITFPQDTAMQQAFSDYQLQQMTSNFIDQFGFNEEDFAEQEDRVSEKFKERISNIDFDINTDEITNAATLFEQACSERVQQFDDQESEEDLWEEKEITFSQSSDSRQNSGTGPMSGIRAVPPTATIDSDEDSASTDSEDELDSPRVIRQSPDASPQQITGSQSIEGVQETPVSSSMTEQSTADSTTAENMDIDNSESNGNWANFDDVSMETASVPPVVDQLPSSWVESSDNAQPEGWAQFSSPTSTSQSSPGADWANFSNLEQSGNINSSESQERSSSPVAMETNDSTSSSSSSRTASYMVPSGSEEVVNKVSSALDNTSQSDNSTLSSSSDIVQSCVAADTTTTTTSDISDSAQQQDVPVSSPQSSSSEPVTSSQSEPAENMHAEDMPVQTSPTGPFSPSSDCSEPQASSQPDANIADSQQCDDQNPSIADNQEYDDEDDDLSDNFNFLAASGLMKCSAESSTSSDVSPLSPGNTGSLSPSNTNPLLPSSTNPQPDCSTSQGEASSTSPSADSKLEAIRAQAREALDQYTAVTTDPSPTHNGPV